jgi:hypothetical protein
VVIARPPTVRRSISGPVVEATGYLRTVALSAALHVVVDIEDCEPSSLTRSAPM